MSNESCVFCSVFDALREKEGVEEGYIVTDHGGLYIADDTEHFYISYGLYPISPGHCIVMPKRHTENRFNLSEDAAIDLNNALKLAREHIENDNLKEIYRAMVDRPLDDKSKRYLRKILDSDYLEEKPDAYNIGENEGQAAGRTVPHMHVHVIPRYEGDVEDPRGGVRNVIPEKGNYKE